MSTTPAPSLRSARIIPLAMGLGVIAITGGSVALRLAGALPGKPELATTLTLVSIGLALGLVPAHFVLRRVLVARIQAERVQVLALLKEGRVHPALVTLTVVGAALAEGAGLLGAVAVLLGGQWFVLAVPVLAVAAILAQVPSRERCEALARG